VRNVQRTRDLIQEIQVDAQPDSSETIGNAHQHRLLILGCLDLHRRLKEALQSPDK
jgi:hypothetical protein